MSDIWGADVPISMPDVPKNDAIIPMGGLGFGFGGLAPDIDEATLQELSNPSYAPIRGRDDDG